jgi:hypothetical protein
VRNSQWTIVNGQLKKKNAEGKMHNAESIDDAESKDANSGTLNVNDQPLIINNEP